MATAKLEYFLVDEDGKGEKMPPEGEVKLVLAWTTAMPDPRARTFWAWASYKDGKWIEQNVQQTDLTEVVEFWCELPKHEDLRYPKS